MNVAELDALRERLERALDSVETMTRSAVEARAAARVGEDVDAYSLDGQDATAGVDLGDLLGMTDLLEPVQVRGWAVVRQFWAVRVPVSDGDGEYDGDEIMEFATKAEAEAYVAAATAPADPS